MIQIGLTGGIASGKSTVASYFRKKRVPVIDADQAARQISRQGRPAYKKIVRLFGPSVLKKNRTLDRVQLGAIVFSSIKKRKQLERIMHPEIRKEISRQIKVLEKKKKKVVVVEAALLFQSDYYKQMDFNIFVQADKRLQFKRLLNKGLSPREARLRLNAQVKKGKRLADFIVPNLGTKRQAFSPLQKIFRTIID
ncbi:MAG: dephospho-CoA kinase [bacterium]|nr:dephospho-CoA kinase [bacterium]